jgi:tRNA-Thr(GGU) m(6)t(6)A37 methyltransferase TsaA
MNVSHSSNIKLIALNKQQLFELIYATEKLEKDLSISISKDLITNQLKQAVAIKLSQMKKVAVEEHSWMTIWMLLVQDYSSLVGLFEFKGPPNQAGRVEIGFGLDPAFDDKQKIAEAVDHLSEWALKQPRCNLVTATSVTNPLMMEVFHAAGFLKMAEAQSGSLWHRYQDPAEIPHKISRHGFESIGVIHTAFETPAGTPIQPNAAQDSQGTIILHPVLVEGLRDLDGFSHIILIYVFDQIGQPRLLVKPFMDDQERGVFATRAPARPNPIGISVVRLLKIEGNLLTFSDADMLNNTPLLDIKPYAPPFEPQTVERMGWLTKRADLLNESKDDGRFVLD